MLIYHIRDVLIASELISRVEYSINPQCFPLLVEENDNKDRRPHQSKAFKCSTAVDESVPKSPMLSLSKIVLNLS